MAETDLPDVEPENSNNPTGELTAKGRPSLRKVRRELSDRELASSGVQRFLLDDIERLERERGDLNEFRNLYFEADKKLGVLNEKLKNFKSHEALYSICLTAGSIALGYAPSVWGAQPSGWISLGFGFALIIAGITSKVLLK